MNDVMNRYFIGYLIEGDAARYCRDLTADFAARFDIKDLSLRLPPHLTIVPPFETDETASLPVHLKDTVSNEHPTPFTLDGFGFFSREGSHGVVYLMVPKDNKFQEQIARITEKLSHFEDIQVPENTHIPHASVARFLTPEKMREIEAYLMVRKRPHFPLVFDGLTLFRHSVDGWVVEQKFPFPA